MVEDDEGKLLPVTKFLTEVQVQTLLAVMRTEGTQTDEAQEVGEVASAHVDGGAQSSCGNSSSSFPNVKFARPPWLEERRNSREPITRKVDVYDGMYRDGFPPDGHEPHVLPP